VEQRFEVCCLADPLSGGTASELGDLPTDFALAQRPYPDCWRRTAFDPFRQGGRAVIPAIPDCTGSSVTCGGPAAGRSAETSRLPGGSPVPSPVSR
jgi:hypothetical protein